MAGEFILMRHAESVASAAGIVSGDPRSVVALTLRGQVQARAAGYKLGSQRLDLSVTSRFLRARQSAELVLAGRQTPVLEMEQLDDLHFGEFEGRPLEEYRDWARANPMTAVIPGGESRVDLAVRYAHAMRHLLARPEATILVVAHGLPLTYVVSAAAGQLPQPVMSYLQYASPHWISAASVQTAVDRLEAWAASPVAP
jgi:2,3-bisphosphoglycerate-dependent phosphoglycerate mutase